MDPITVAMSNAFVPFPSGAVTGLLPPGPPPRRKIDYGSGVVVSPAGHILTDRQVTDACRSITVVGATSTFGSAEVMATDKLTDLALIRLYGASDMNALSLGESMPASATVFGVADPQLQDGGRAVTTVTAQLRDAGPGARTLEPTPVSGFSGGAALDADARLVGLVAIKQADMATPPRAALVPAATIKAFLYSHSVAPSTGNASLDAAKAAVVRVICVRR